jgi:hypothetical protein
MNDSYTKPTKYLPFGHILLFTVSILLSGNYISYGQKEVILNFQHRKYEEKTRQLVFWQNFNYIEISTSDTIIFFTSTIPILRDNTIIKLDGWKSYSIPIDDILIIKKGKGYAKSMAQIILAMTVFPLGASGIYWISGDREEARNALIFSAAIAILTLPVIGITSIESRYNMKKWKLVSIQEKSNITD